MRLSHISALLPHDGHATIAVSILRLLELSRDVIPNLYMKDCMNQDYRGREKSARR